MSRLPLVSRGRSAILVVIGFAVALYLLLIVGSFLDSSFAGERIGRNISFAGQPVSGQTVDDLDEALRSMNQRYGSTPVDINAGHGSAHAPASDLGLSIDVQRSSDRVRAANEPSLMGRPVLWVRSFFGNRDVDAAFLVDDPQLRSALLELELPGITEWKPPSLQGDGDGVRVVGGTLGTGLDPGQFSTQLLKAAESTGLGDGPIVVIPQLVEVAPPISDEAIAAVAADAETATASPLEVTAGSMVATIEVPTLRSWVELHIDGDEVTWGLEQGEVANTIGELLTDTASPHRNVSFVVEEGQVRIVPDDQPTVCCAPGSPDRILEALRSGSGAVTLALSSKIPSDAREWAEGLGIVEEVATFSSSHACCQNRVVNIHLIADATRGVVIEPGETFSLNGHVGRRTETKGYLPAGGITNGVLVDQLGGGISQFTTTLFNAAFFAGLDFVEYQAHSIYFARYPYGREATLSFPAPDLKIRNTSDYGVLIWPTYTDTTITVTLYSTRHVSVEQTGQTTSPQGECTRVRTERTRTYDDGRVVLDTFGALYRPGEGLTCTGESSVPTTTTEPPPTTTTTEPPPTTTTTEPPPPTTTEPPEQGE